MTELEARELIDKYLTGSTLKRLFTSGTQMRKFYELVNSVPQLSQLYAHAQQTKAELYADEIIEIADTILDPNKARVMVDARKWVASKIKPDKYGDRIDLNITQSVDITKALSDAKQRVVLSTCYPIDTASTQRVEMIEEKPPVNTGSKPVHSDPDDIFS
jgi:hemoglobin-like flavoprotein